MKYINTDRCILRPLRTSDSYQLFKTLGDREVYKFIPYDAYPSVDSVKKAIDEHFTKRMVDGDACELGIEFKENGNIIGTCGFTIIDDGLGVLGYLLEKDYWGKGIMSELVSVMVDFGFNNLNLDLIVAYCMTNNSASKKVLLRNNFTYVGDGVMRTNGGEFVMSNYVLSKPDQASL